MVTVTTKLGTNPNHKARNWKFIGPFLTNAENWLQRLKSNDVWENYAPLTLITLIAKTTISKERALEDKTH